MGITIAGRDILATVVSQKRLQAIFKVTLTDSKVPQVHRQHLEHFYRELPWVRWPYQQVKIGHWDAPFTLLPAVYAHLPLEEVGAIMHNQASAWECPPSTLGYQVTFHADKGLQEWVQQSFENATLIHPWQCMLPFWQQAGRHINGLHLNIHVHMNRLHLAVFDHAEIALVNSFNYSSAEDFLYFALLAYEQLDLDVNEHPLILSGEISRAGQLFPLLYRYIREIRFMNWPSDWEIGDFTGDIPGHYYIDGLALLS